MSFLPYTPHHELTIRGFKEILSLDEPSLTRDLFNSFLAKRAVDYPQLAASDTRGTTFRRKQPYLYSQPRTEVPVDLRIAKILENAFPPVTQSKYVSVRFPTDTSVVLGEGVFHWLSTSYVAALATPVSHLFHGL